MPIHDWTRVDAGVFHDFHQAWILEIKRALNSGLLPRDYYAMAEQHAGGYQPDVLTLRMEDEAEGPGNGRSEAPGGGGGLLVADPKVRFRAETDLDFYRRKQTVVAVRHVSGDELVAVVEIVSKANKSGRLGFEGFVGKAAELMSRGVHVVIVDLQPPTARDPQGIHGAIWEQVTDSDDYRAPGDKPLTLASYEAGGGLRAFVEPVAVGDVLIDMPLFLSQRAYVPLPLEATYAAAFEAVPWRWRQVVEAG